jgi:DNA-binding IclR family transcriptional regulator
MPDLKSELMKLPDLSKLSFDDPGEPDMQTTTTAHPSSLGVSETFFNLIRDNPGLHRSQLVDMAEQAGVTRSSSSSLLGQFTKRGLITAVDNGTGLVFTAIGLAYTKGYVRKDKAAKVKRVAKETPATQSTPDNSLRVVETVPELLNALSIVQARELYDALKKIFGA